MAEDVITLITRDHREMEKLFELLRLDRGQRPQNLGKLEAMFIAHSRAEEEKIYPAIAEEADEGEEVRHGAEEHHEAERLLMRLKECDPQSKEFDQRLQKFVEAVNHHVHEEEAEVLPALKQAVSDTRLRELGRVFNTLRAQEMQKFGEGSVQQIPKQRLHEEARELGIEGHSKMNKKELADAVEKARQS